jgi:hypothetical protein
VRSLRGGRIEGRHLKYETPAPPGVAIPDTLDTRIGTLHFFGGFPDAASAAKLYDNLDFQRAVQAYLLTLPVVNQVANRDNILTIGSANTTVSIWETMVDSRTVELTANDNTPCSMAQTDQQFPSVSSQDKGLKADADGSVDVYFGPKPPAGQDMAARRNPGAAVT